MKSLNLLKIFNENFGVKVFIKFIFFVILICFSFTTFFILQQSKSLTDNLIKEGELLAKLLSYNSRLGVFVENKDLLMNSVEGLLQHEKVLSVSIFTMEGNLLIEEERQGRKTQGQSVKVDHNKLKHIIERIKKSKSSFYFEGADTFEFWAPVIPGLSYPVGESLFFDKDSLLKKDNIIGIVKVVLDKKILNKQLGVLLFKGILIGIIFLLFGSIVTYLMVKKITKPLNKLTKSVKAFGTGITVEKVPVETKDEIGKLALAFNTMIIEREQAEEKLRVYQDQLRSLASQLSLVEEQERHRIAMELHDHIGHALAISKIKLEALQELLSSTDLTKHVDEICSLIGQTIEYTRSLTFEVSPPIFYELGFEAAVEWLSEQIQEKHNIIVDVEDDKQTKPMNEEIRILLLRVINELLINIVKHAQAHKAKVSIQRDDNNVRVVVEDDGVGFDISEANLGRSGGGFGLFSIRERLKYLGGNFKIESKPGFGTRVTIVTPVLHIFDSSIS